MRFSIGFAKTFFETTARRIIRFKEAYVESLKSDNYDWLDNFPQGKYSQRETPCYPVNDTQLPSSINLDDLVSAKRYSMANKVDKFSDND